MKTVLITGAGTGFGHEVALRLAERGFDVIAAVEIWAQRLDTPSPLPTSESFMDTLDPIYPNFPTYRSLHEHLRGALRILLAEEARQWIKEDVPAGRTAKAHLAIARRSSRRK